MNDQQQEQQEEQEQQQMQQQQKQQQSSKKSVKDRVLLTVHTDEDCELAVAPSSSSRSRGAASELSTTPSPIHSPTSPTSSTDDEYNELVGSPSLVYAEDSPRSLPMLSESSSSSSSSSGISLRLEPTNTEDSTSSLKAFAITCSTKWTKMVQKTHKPVLKLLKFLSNISAKNPYRTICCVTIFSLLLLLIGFATNFQLEVEEDVLWTPQGSSPLLHRQWIDEESNFSKKPTYFTIFAHFYGANAIHQIQHVMAAYNKVVTSPGYKELCGGNETVVYDKEICEIIGIPRFWNFSMDIYEQDPDPIATISQTTYPSTQPVVRNHIFGYEQINNNTQEIEYLKSYEIVFLLPRTDEVHDWQLDTVYDMIDWDNDNTEQNIPLKVNFITEASFGAEFTRGIAKDVPLAPIMFILMSLFTSLVFANWKNPLLSRAALGASAVVAVLLSVATGFGLLFCIGVPFTPITQMLPFILFGIGLDDAFIVMGAYCRTSRHKPIVDRIQETIEDIGLSIALTTITSTTAFGLGCVSSVPAVIWLCLYAFPTILLILLYQVTFFVACIVIDDQRVQNRRRDFLCCYKVSDDVVSDADETNQKGHVADRIMVWYADKLLRKTTKIVVVVIFTLLVGFCGWSASQFTQEFKFTEILPSDSHISAFLRAEDAYYPEGTVTAEVVFRYVDHSDPNIQAQMQNYIDDLVQLDFVTGPPSLFWLDYFNFIGALTPGFTDLPFNEQVNKFLSNPVMYDLFHRQLGIDEDGNISESIVNLGLHIDLDDVKLQIDIYKEILDVTKSQPVNQNTDDWAFFTYDTTYNMFEFYTVAVEELILTTIVGIAAMALVAFLFIPHWTAAFFVLPLMCVLYVDLLGVMQLAGLHINAVTYVCLAMSIGLMVDFIMHVLFRYYESPGNRIEKTIEMLRTLGASILLGGTTTALGTLPLIFSSSSIFYTVFVAFAGIVVLGMAHGLILLPVILSTIGPEEQVFLSHVGGVRQGGKEAEQVLRDFRMTTSYGSSASASEEDGQCLSSPSSSVDASEQDQQRQETDANNRHLSIQVVPRASSYDSRTVDGDSPRTPADSPSSMASIRFEI